MTFKKFVVDLNKSKEDAPGQNKDDSPGQSEDAPGQGGDSPGQSEYAPGHNKNKKRNKHKQNNYFSNYNFSYVPKYEICEYCGIEYNLNDGHTCWAKESARFEIGE